MRDLMLVCAILLIVGLGAWFLSQPPELHSYLVVRFNPSQEALLMPTRSDGNNPTLIVTNVLAYSYVHERSDCYRFAFPGGEDLICGIVHVKDSGAWSAGGAQ